MLIFEPVKFRLHGEDILFRSKVPGGWLIIHAHTHVTFYPDPSHKWNGSSLE